MIRAVATRREQTVCISGLTGEGLSELLERVSGKLQVRRRLQVAHLEALRLPSGGILKCCVW